MRGMKTTRSIRTLALCSLLAAGLLLGCGSQEPEPTAPAETAQTESPVAEQARPDATDGPDQKKPVVLDVRVSVPSMVKPGFEAVKLYTDQFYAGEFDKLHDKFSDEMKTTVSLDKLREIHAFVAERYGHEVQVLGEDQQTKDDYRGFVRWARFSDYDGVIEIQWILHPDDTVAGFLIEPSQKPAGSG
jgi:hypothetical protein